MEFQIFQDLSEIGLYGLQDLTTSRQKLSTNFENNMDETKIYKEGLTERAIILCKLSAI